MAAANSATTQTCPSCGASIDTRDADPLARISCPSCGEKVRVERRFDHFVLLETLGIGGMGTVYKARDTLLDRDVALKLLRKDLEGGVDQAQQLQQEARVAASVNHPNVVQVFSSGTDHGQFYLVMELVDHGSLDDFIEQQKQLPEEKVLESAIQVAKGLRAAYAKGLIHRDVKPANILFNEENVAKIGDFGLAGVAAQSAEDRGEIWGTPYYVAPERLNNAPEDFRSDIYSLGATLFHATAGRAPIEGETNSAVTLLNLKKKPLNLAAIATGVSEPTARVFHRMLAFDPAQRFSSYDELVRELEQAYGLLTGKKEFLKQRRSKMPWLIGIAVLTVALVAVGAWAYVSRKYAETQLTAVSARAEQLVTLAPLEASAAEGRRQLVADRFNQAADIFGDVANKAKNQQPFYDWALLQQGLADLVGRKISRAEEAFVKIENAGPTGFVKDDIDLATFFVATAKKLRERGAISASDGGGIDGASYKTFSLILFGLKDVNQGDVNNAAALLKQFVEAKPTGKFGWIADLKPVAQRYLRDCEIYAAWKEESAKASDITALSASLGKLRQVQKDLGGEKGKGARRAIFDESRAEETRLNQRIVDLQKTTETTRLQERQVQAQEFARNKSAWLKEWKTKLITDLNRAHYLGNISDSGGAPYTGISGATEQKLKMQTPYGVAEMPWEKLSPKTLLAISVSFVKPNMPDVADRQWLCAVYARETGQMEDARRLAEDAAKAKPEYRDKIPLLGK